MGTYRLRVPPSRVGYVLEAQGGLPPGPRVPVRTGYAYQPQALGTYSVPWQPRYSKLPRQLGDALLRAVRSARDEADAIRNCEALVGPDSSSRDGAPDGRDT